MQCKAEYQLYDKDGKRIITFFCVLERDHEEDHEHILTWSEEKYEFFL